MLQFSKYGYEFSLQYFIDFEAEYAVWRKPRSSGFYARYLFKNLNKPAVMVHISRLILITSDLDIESGGISNPG